MFVDIRNQYSHWNKNQHLKNQSFVWSGLLTTKSILVIIYNKNTSATKSSKSDQTSIKKYKKSWEP
jgi:hypothetical protein